MVSGLDFDGARPPSPFLNENHHQWRDALRRFVDQEIVPRIETWEEAGYIDRGLFKKASDFGLLRMGYPEAYGGIKEGIDQFHGLVTSEELARPGAGGVVASLMVHGIGLPPVLALGDEALKAEVVPSILNGETLISLGITEPSGGSDVAALRTTAQRDGDDYIVNGSKTYITGGMRADVMTTAVRTGGEGSGGISLLLIDMNSPGVSRTPLPKMGWWASDTAAIYFDDVRVPADRILGRENGGFIGIMTNFNSERLAMAAGALGAARACLEDAASWARERSTFGKRLADHQVIRHKFAEMVRLINATQAYLEMCAWRVQNGETPVADLSLLKVQATTTLEFCAREAAQILGGASFIRGNRVERIYREVRVQAIGGGSEEIMRDLASRQLGL